MKTDPLVSVIMPAFNSAEYIGEAIESVIAQSHQNWELIIIDDFSTDNTLQIIKKFLSAESRIKLLTNHINLGAGITRNKGINAANGSYIAFLDADDRWLPQKLQVQLDFMLKNDLSMTFSSYNLMDENGNQLNEKIEALPILTYDKLLKSNYVGNLTGIYSVEKMGKITGPEIRKRQDWGLWLKILQKNDSTRGISEPLAEYRIRKNSMSSNKIEMIQWNYKVYREVLGFSAFKSSLCMISFLREHFLIKKRQRILTN